MRLLLFSSLFFFFFLRFLFFFFPSDVDIRPLVASLFDLFRFSCAISPNIPTPCFGVRHFLSSYPDDTGDATWQHCHHKKKKNTSPCDQQRDKGDKERETVSVEEVLVVNQMTWPELARQCIVANVRKRRTPPASAGRPAVLYDAPRFVLRVSSPGRERQNGMG